MYYKEGKCNEKHSGKVSLQRSEAIKKFKPAPVYSLREDETVVSA